MKQEIHVASPCSADWNRMAGDERVRYCSECKLDVYNFSEMPDADIETIVAHRSGRLCARFYRRSDGTMMTQNCPVGFRAVVRQVSSFASAALAAMLSVGTAFAGGPPTEHGTSLLQIQAAETGLSLEVVDAFGAVVPRARITIVNEKTKEKVNGETDMHGRLRVADLPTGKYEITVLVPGFKTLKQKSVSVPGRIPLRLQVDVAMMMGVVVVVNGPQPETETAPVSKIPVGASSEGLK